MKKNHFSKSYYGKFKTGLKKGCHVFEFGLQLRKKTDPLTLDYNHLSTILFYITTLDLASLQRRSKLI